MTATNPTAREIAAAKFAALLADAADGFDPCNPRKSYRTENDLFVITPNSRIGKDVLGFVWDDLSPPYRPGAESHLNLEDGLVFLARQALGMYQPHDGEFHRLQKVVWSDGGWSWASFSWSLFGGESEPATLYIQGPTGSTYLTARFEKETLRHPIR